MKSLPTRIPDLRLLEPVIHGDARGFFFEMYNQRTFASLGIDRLFVQCNRSRSRQGVIRGLHYQRRHPQAKLVQVTAGEVFDVAVDIRRGSPTFGHWDGAVLSAENQRRLFVPEGFAHGFAVLSTQADFLYFCSDFYDPDDEHTLCWNDPDLAIDWPEIANVSLSARDRNARRLRDVEVGLLPDF